MYKIFEQRHSIRKFEPDPICDEDLIAIIKAGASAPSGHNIQNWHFVLISNKSLISEIAEVIDARIKEISSQLKDPGGFLKYSRFYTFFKDAPHLLLLFSKHYPPSGLSELIEINAPRQIIDQLIATAPGIQNAAAAMENIQLAAAALGYGGVWMTGPLFAANEIEKLVPPPEEGYFIAAMTPLGRPLKSQKNSPHKKDLEEIFTHIK